MDGLDGFDGPRGERERLWSPMILFLTIATNDDGRDFCLCIRWLVRFSLSQPYACVHTRETMDIYIAQ